jgi:ABC-type methionine transport system ATPase subunit
MLQTQLDIPLILITREEEDVDCFADVVIHIQDGRRIEKTKDHDALATR